MILRSQGFSDSKRSLGRPRPIFSSHTITAQGVTTLLEPPVWRIRANCRRPYAESIVIGLTFRAASVRARGLRHKDEPTSRFSAGDLRVCGRAVGEGNHPIDHGRL